MDCAPCPRPSNLRRRRRGEEGGEEEEESDESCKEKMARFSLGELLDAAEGSC